MTRMGLMASLVAVATLAAGAPACKKSGGGTAGKPGAGPGGEGGGGGKRRALEYPVELQLVAAQPVEFTVNAVGSVEAFEMVQVTARVAGVVERVRFTEGQAAKQSQVLVEIEPARYQLAVQAAEAASQKAEAARAEADAGLGRREQALKENPGLIRGEELETWRTKQRIAAADADQARVALAQARLNLRDAYVRAPMAGLIQTRTVQTGQYVQPGTVLATLLRRDPLLLKFQVPEHEAQRITVGSAARFRVRDDGLEHHARVTHVAGAADVGSRMVAVTAEIGSAEAVPLRPGSFAEITVPVGAAVAMPVVPETAIRPSDKGMLAFVVEDGLAHQRVLEVGMRTGDGRVEVRTGLKVGEQLVVRGAEPLRDGVKVRTGAPAADPGAGARP